MKARKIMKNKEKNPYANISIKKITAPKKPKIVPKGTKLVGGDLRAKDGK